MHMDRHSLVVGMHMDIYSLTFIAHYEPIRCWLFFFILLFTYNECIILRLTCNYLPPVGTVTCLNIDVLFGTRDTFLWIFLFQVRSKSKILEIQKRLSGIIPLRVVNILLTLFLFICFLVFFPPFLQEYW